MAIVKQIDSAFLNSPESREKLVMGVVTVVTLDYGRIFGPLSPSPLVPDPVSHIGLMTSDTFNRSVMLQVDPERESIDQPQWLSYIRAAREQDEQNMEAYVKEGGVYFRSLRIIKADEELLVWYSKDLALILTIPELPSAHVQESSEYICRECGALFQFPYSLRAHVRFKCRTNRNSSDDVANRERKRSDTPNKLTVPGARVTEIGMTTPEVNAGLYVAQKRPLDMSATGGPVNKQSRLESDDPSSSSSKRRDDDKLKDCNQNIDIARTSHSEGHSAFRKVEKSSSASSLSSSSVFTGTSLSGLTGRLPSAPCVDVLQKRALFLPNKSALLGPGFSTLHKAQGWMNGNILGTSLLQMFPLGPPLATGIGHFMNSPQITGPFNKSAMGSDPLLKLTKDIVSKNSVTEENRDINMNITKYPLQIERGVMAASLPVMRPVNPMIDKIMHNSSVPLASPVNPMSMAQNWCAQCNATFRMTSDLVYHMRSHHKREFDPIKRKRDEKLKCGICNESFRERHHLTRHMTSHL